MVPANGVLDFAADLDTDHALPVIEEVVEMRKEVLTGDSLNMSIDLSQNTQILGQHNHVVDLDRADGETPYGADGHCLDAGKCGLPNAVQRNKRQPRGNGWIHHRGVGPGVQDEVEWSLLVRFHRDYNQVVNQTKANLRLRPKALGGSTDG